MTATYRAAVVREAHGPIRVEDVPLREPAGDEVLIEVTACGLCHSDVHFMHGTSGSDFPYLVGHEVAGRVAALGPAATGLAEGDAVVVAPMVPCGRCKHCAVGRPQACPDRLLRRPGVVLGAVGGPRTFAMATGMRASGSRLVVGAPKRGDVTELGLRELFLGGGSIRVSIWGYDQLLAGEALRSVVLL